MYSKFQLQNECSSRAMFEQGLSLCKENKINKIKYENRNENGEGRQREIKSTVEGEHGVYSVRLIIDEKDDAQGSGELKLRYCSCPGNSNNGEFCKHCIATLIKYLELRDSGKEGEMFVASGEDGDTESTVVATNEAFLEILKLHNARKKLAVSQKNQKGSMRVVPYLTVSDVSADVEFRAGREKLYIIRDVSAFVKAVKENKPYQYGKNLEFTHSMDLFDEHSQRVIDFMERYDRNKKTHTVSYAHRIDQEYRFITLKNGALDSFFEAVAGCSVLTSTDMAAVTEGFTGNREYYEVKNELPELNLLVKGIKGGVVVKGDFPRVLIGLDRYIIVKEKCIYSVLKSEMQDMELFWNFIADNDSKELFVSEADLPLFTTELLQILKRYYDVTFEDFDENKYLPEKANFKIYLDAPKKDIITCEVYAVYGEGKPGEKKFNIFADRVYAAEVARDEVAEMGVFIEIKKYFNKYDPKKKVAVLMQDENRLYEFVTEGVYAMQGLGDVYVSDKIKAIKVKASPKISAGVSLNGELLSFSLQSAEFSGEQLAEILSKYDKKKKFFRLTDGTFINVDAEGFENIANITKVLHLTQEQIASGTVEVPKFRALFLDNELMDSGNVSTGRNKEFRALIRNMKTVEDNDFEVPETLKDVLRYYQKYGFRWLKTLRHNGFGGILADDMGLGKTLQVITFLLSEQEEGRKERSLIVCPASLVFNWKNEFERFAPQLKPVVITGALNERADLIAATKPGDILITSYDLLKRDIEHYEGMRFACQVIDEAQYIKNNATQSSKSVKSIKADFKIALTGTPIENRLSELWSIFDYMMPGFLHSYPQFRDEFELPIVQFKNKDDMKRLQKMIRPFILRRLKSEVLKDLPDKIEEPLTTRLEGEQRALYDASLAALKNSVNSTTGAEFKREKLQILAELMKLRQLCCDPSLLYDDYNAGSAKVEMCIDLVRRAIDGGHKILLFSQFTSMLDILQRRLEQEGIEFFSLVGSTPKERRAEMTEEFNKGNVPVFCISLKAGGTGLNLTAADIVIHFDPWWNVAVQNQATDRAHRIGQKNVVTVYKLIAIGTIEENIMKLQEKKKHLAEQLLSGDEFNATSLTKEELLEILGE